MNLGLRLTLLNGLVLLLALGAFAFVAYVTQQQAMQSSLDAVLREQARWLGENLNVGPEGGRGGPPAVRFPGPQRFSAPGVFVQITTRDGATIARSLNLDDELLPTSAETLERALRGEQWFTNVELDGHPLRLLVAPLRAGRPGESGPSGMIQVALPLTQMHANLQALQATFLSLGLVGVLVSLLAGWLLSRAALRPIDRLAAIAHLIGEARDFSRRVPLPARRRRDEVGRLAEEFNRMLAQLQAAYEQVEAALAAQRRLVADASHELRTPLTSLRGNVELLRRMVAVPESRADSEEQAQVLADMAGETERLTRLVGDLLLLARADAGQHLALEPTDLGSVVREAFRGARFLREGVELRLGDVPRSAWVVGDADRLKQLLLILLDNALKYTPAGGLVTLDARTLVRAGVDGIAVCVVDTGPGIAPDEQSRIFERFYRADRARGSSGAGLGLAIARWIVDEHRGALAVESVPAQGSTFTVWLQTTPPPPLPPAAPDRVVAGLLAVAG